MEHGVACILLHSDLYWNTKLKVSVSENKNR